MGVYIIEYSQDTDFVLAVQDQMLGSPVVIKNKKGLAPRYAFWDVDFDSGVISLNSSGGGIAIGATPIAAESYAKLALRQDAIHFDFFLHPGYLMVDVNPPLCLDVKDRRIADGTPTWLYPYNGSPAQQWNLVPLRNLNAFE
ncbi:RICIN domain-containing protein [Burkholderia vietnamiensis]|jgi:hypothetical protein|uniref:RICIN domain-containing protein n=1 Tax=Burkholderia vietnamiensis TaxID=60552 RepID=UPI0007583FE5|nr:RICIN domain-containing protein [Burkholderia vietnamiensis]TPQ48184.1 hypothetical protein C2U71_01520 [Burkholderia ubonensis]AOJ12212.1 hypothetical protein WJ02_00705 [Burkholderia vietnamiensis]KVE22614.1 hypothetical protein WI93_21820 [Burkholderia vietnamiensis]KVE95740.1 hypothetical protein WJ01_12135 [Burkholderia vietnamiensis]KVE98552.1 hypothetical protein WJ03_16180 [Burkholderia vietnamiensis]